MAVIKFKKETNGFSIKNGSKPKFSFFGGVNHLSPSEDDFFLSFVIDAQAYHYNLNIDTIEINGVDVTANGASAICDQLRDEVFPEANSSSGGSGMVLESYQNSVMAAPMQCYVFRDADDNIVRVYEPLRNNDVSRKVYAYTDSIDKFPFDSVDCFNSVLKDVKLVDIAGDIKIQGCELKAIAIDGNSHTGLELINTTWNGNYATGIASGFDLVVVGNSVVIHSCEIKFFFLNNIPANSSFKNSWFLGEHDSVEDYIDIVNNDGSNNVIWTNNIIFSSKLTHDFDGVTASTLDAQYNYIYEINSTWAGDVTVYDNLFVDSDIIISNSHLQYNDFGQTFQVEISGCPNFSNNFFRGIKGFTTSFDNCSQVIFNSFFHNSAAIVANANFIYNKLDHNSYVENGGFVIDSCSFGNMAIVTASGNMSYKSFVNLGSTTYELGVSGGNITATAVS